MDGLKVVLISEEITDYVEPPYEELMPKVATIPPYDVFMNPLLQALKALGGSGTIEETNAKAVELLGLSDE
jgi:hypothetical protein